MYGRMTAALERRGWLESRGRHGGGRWRRVPFYRLEKRTMRQALPVFQVVVSVVSSVFQGRAY